jgi:flagellar hook-length control protein FliK
MPQAATVIQNTPINTNEAPIDRMTSEERTNPQPADAKPVATKHLPPQAQADEPVADEPQLERDDQSAAKLQTTSQETTSADEPAMDDTEQPAPAPSLTDKNPQPLEVATPAASHGSDSMPVRVAHSPPPPSPAPDAPEVRFAVDNHASIIHAIRGELIPGGGSMHIRLDPPELGALQVSVQMRDGIMTAAFHTSTDEATRVLSHSLTQLKHALEQQGVSIEKIHVQQSPRDSQSNFNNDDSRQRQSAFDHSSPQQEQQRRDALARMWRRLTDGSDPLDLVA